MSLGLRMEEMIFSTADNHLFFNDLEVSVQVVVVVVVVVIKMMLMIMFVITAFNHQLVVFCDLSDTRLTVSA